MTTPNAEEIDRWNDATGKSWALLHERLDRQIAPIGHAAMAKADFGPGQQVLDVGCGCGETTLEIAGKVAPGAVTGLDVSAMLLDIARQSAAAGSASNVQFIRADAQVHALPLAAFDRLFSRFGVMFFEDPGAAFVNLRKALRPGGRVAFCCWRTPAENQWLSLPMQAVAHMLPPLPPPDPNAPGPFAFANRDRLHGILAGAGFADVAIDALDLNTGADTLEDSVTMALRMGPLGSALRQLGADDALKRRIENALREALQAHQSGGVIKLPAAAWIVSARNP